MKRLIIIIKRTWFSYSDLTKCLKVHAIFCFLLFFLNYECHGKKEFGMKKWGEN